MDTNSTFFDLELPAADRFTRELRFKLSQGFGLCVWMFALPSQQSIGYASAQIGECNLNITKADTYLRIGTAIITLTAEEAARVWNTFRDRGLRLASFSELPCASTPLSPPAKQATPTAYPLGGDCGVVPVSALDTGPLEPDDEPDHCAIVRALIAHENY